MKHVIHVNPGGVGEPVQLAEFRRCSDAEPVIKMLDDSEVALHLSMSEQFNKYISEFPKQFQDIKGTSAIPDPE